MSKGSKESSNKNDKTPSAVQIPPDPSVWIDFNKLGLHMTCLYIFFKLSQFNSSVKITDIGQPIGKDVGKGKSDKGKKGKGDEGTKMIIWPNLVLPNRNEPIYLFMDSIDYKLIVMNFAQVGNAKVLEIPHPQTKSWSNIPLVSSSLEFTLIRHDEQYVLDNLLKFDLSEHKFELVKPLVPLANVVIENYNWQNDKVDNAVIFLNTYGSKTLLIDVKPGRFVFRMWIKSDTSYVINLMSDSSIVAGTLETVLESMSQESERLMQMCDNISSSYGQLVQKFGTPQFCEGLRVFYNSYRPTLKLKKQEMSIVHDAFMQEFLKIIKENVSSAEFNDRLFALKVLFINPRLRYNENQEIKIDYDENSTIKIKDDVREWKKTENAAVTIQALFKKLLVKKLRSLHQESHECYMKIFEALKKIYTDWFSVYGRMLYCCTLVRNLLLCNTDLAKLKPCYSIINDLNSTIYLQHFTGVIMVTENAWVPITRHVFYCNSPNPIVIKVCLFCTFPKYMVRVFDNDTTKEIYRFTNNVSVNSYDGNLTGYTVLCYGWADTAGDHQWKLDFVTVKLKASSLLIVPPVTISNHVLRQNYRPNANNQICRCVVNINHDVLVTFRLSVSYENVKMHFRCLNEVGQILCEIYGIQNVILPAITLKHMEIVDRPAEVQSTSSSSLTTKIRKASIARSRSGSLTRTSTSSSIKRGDKNSDKINHDKHSPKGSIASLKRRRSVSIETESIKYKDTVYIVEAFVLDDSWPLTKQEWDVVEEIKKQALLGRPETDSNASESHTSSKKIK